MLILSHVGRGTEGGRLEPERRAVACPGGGMRCGAPRHTCFSERAAFAEDDEWGAQVRGC